MPNSSSDDNSLLEYKLNQQRCAPQCACDIGLQLHAVHGLHASSQLSSGPFTTADLKGGACAAADKWPWTFLKP